MSIETREYKVIVCDTCNAEVRCTPELAELGWMKYGTTGPGGTTCQYACPLCSKE